MMLSDKVFTPFLVRIVWVVESAGLKLSWEEEKKINKLNIQN